MKDKLLLSGDVIQTFIKGNNGHKEYTGETPRNLSKNYMEKDVFQTNTLNALVTNHDEFDHNFELKKMML